MIDRIITDDRMRRNNESLILAASGKEQKPPKQATPGLKDGGGGGGGGRGGKADGKGGKTGRNGKKPTGGSTSNASDSDSESESGKGPYSKPLDDFKGTLIKDVPEDQLCCLHFAWGLCKRGDNCKYPHVDACTPAMRKTKNFKRLAHYYGNPEDYKKKAAAKAQAKAAPANPLMCAVGLCWRSFGLSLGRHFLTVIFGIPVILRKTFEILSLPHGGRTTIYMRVLTIIPSFA